MKINFKIITLIFAASILIIACKPQVNMNPDSGADPKLVAKNQQALTEIARLSSLAGKQAISESNLDNLKSMLKDDLDAQDELKEIGMMIKYKEYEHAAHGLSFLDGYLRTGKKVICPGHELLHYYVFESHNENDMASDALKAAKDEMPNWIPIARAYNDKYPNGENFDNIVNTLNNHIKNIESGKTTITNSEMDYLDGKASICVQG